MMSREEIEKRLVEVLGTVLGHPVTASVVRAGEKSWDSLKHIEIVFAIEEQFGARFSEDEIAAAGSLADFATFLQEHLAP